MSNGDVMKYKTRENRGFRAREWVIGSAAVLLLLSGGLALLAQHARDQANVVTALLALHLASWSYVVSIVGLLLLPVLELVGLWRMRVKQAAIRRYSSAEPRHRRLETPKLEGARSTRQSVGPLLANPSSRKRGDGNENIGLNRVA